MERRPVKRTVEGKECRGCEKLKPYAVTVKPDSCDQCGSMDIYAIELTTEAAGNEVAYACRDCERWVTPREVLSSIDVYNKCAEYYALGLDQAQLEVKRKALKAEVQQALQDWGAGAFEQEGFKAAFRAGRKSVNHKQMAIDLTDAKRVAALEAQYTKVGEPYFQIDGPKI